MPVWLAVCQTAVIALSLFMAPVTIWMGITVLIGLFKSKTLEAEITRCYKFAVLICARNEEYVIGNLIDSLLRQDYRGEYGIYVVADNCTDDTAEAARLRGATVFVRNDAHNIGKGHAMRFGVNRILESRPDTEAICVFDADNLASESFLTEINRAFNSGAQIVNGYRDTKNIHETWVTEVYSIYWLMLMRFYYAPRFALGLSPMVGGTGFGFLVSCLDEKKWRTETLTEDVEFSIQQILKNNKIVPARKAVFYDEQPATFKDSVKQRIRWMTGGIQCLFLYFKKVFRGIIDGRKNLWDVLWYLFFIPTTGLTLVLNALSIVVAYATSMFNEYATFFVIIMTILTVLLAWITAYATLKLEKRNIKSMRRAILLYPIFMFTMMIIALISIFRPKAEWTPIKHSNSLTIEERERERQTD